MGWCTTTVYVQNSSLAKVLCGGFVVWEVVKVRVKVVSVLGLATGSPLLVVNVVVVVVVVSVVVLVVIVLRAGILSVILGAVLAAASAAAAALADA